jgi:hypothetical protein
MKKNDMLNESTIRRFMKLATIDGLSDKFVDEKLQESDEQELEERGGMKPNRDDEEMREGEEDLEEAKDEDLEEAKDEDLEEAKDDDEMREGADEELDEMGDMPMDRDEEEVEMDMDLDMDAAEPAADAGGMVSVDQLMSALERALEDVLGQEVEVSQDDEEAGADMDLDMDAPDAGDELGLDADAEEDEEELDLDEATPKTDVVEEVYARVIQRLTQETKSNKK